MTPRRLLPQDIPLDKNLDYALLRIYAYYRLGLSLLMLVMFLSNVAPNILGSQEPSLFFYTSGAYCASCLLTLIVLWFKAFSPKSEQVFLVLMVDIAALIMLMHSSGGASSGLAFLLLVVVAVGGILLNLQISSALTGVATIALLAESLYLFEENSDSHRDIFTSGLLGALLFASTLTFHYFSSRLRRSALETAQQKAHARHLQRLAQMIIERMQTGIVVATPQGEVELINRAAETLLAWPTTTTANTHKNLRDIPKLEELTELWRYYPDTRPPSSQMGASKTEVRLRFSPLSEDTQASSEKDSDTLIFVEDTRDLHREAQNIKLASLGRLTASIAHEIRNPLGAISHAEQLLAESTDLNPADQRLLEIIATNTQRVNQIIENVMQLSRRRSTQPQLFDLRHWLQQFMDDYEETASQQSANDALKLDLLKLDSDTLDQDTPLNKDAPLNVRFDASHLSQILTNLTDNGLRHGAQVSDQPNITYQLGKNRSTQRPFLLVIDDGNGINEEHLQHIFEPFFTTEASGSGLGLFLCRELCEANYADLSYQRISGKHTSDKRSCFRIDFAHPDRIF